MPAGTCAPFGADCLGKITQHTAGLLEAAAARPQVSSVRRGRISNARGQGRRTRPLDRSQITPWPTGTSGWRSPASSAFLGINGRRLTLTADEAYELIIAISTGELKEVPDIAAEIRRSTADWR